MFFNMSTLKKKTCWTAKWLAYSQKGWNQHESLVPWCGNQQAKLLWFRMISTRVARIPTRHAWLCLVGGSCVRLRPFWGRLEIGSFYWKKWWFWWPFVIGRTWVMAQHHQILWVQSRILICHTETSSRHNQGWPPKKRTRDVSQVGWPEHDGYP